MSPSPDPAEPIVLLYFCFNGDPASLTRDNILSRAKGAVSPVNRQSAGQRRDTVQKSLSPFDRLTDCIKYT